MAEYQGSVLREGLYFGECPRWHDGRLWYSDFFDHVVHALAPGGADERVVEVAGQPAGRMSGTSVSTFTRSWRVSPGSSGRRCCTASIPTGR